jgi:hypothetical protein
VRKFCSDSPILFFIINIKTKLFALLLLKAEHDIVLFPAHLALLETNRHDIFMKVWNTQALIDAGKVVRPDSAHHHNYLRQTSVAKAPSRLFVLPCFSSRE